MTTAELNSIPGHKVTRHKGKLFGDSGQPVYYYTCSCGYSSRPTLHWNGARAAIEADHLVHLYRTTTQAAQ